MTNEISRMMGQPVTADEESRRRVVWEEYAGSELSTPLYALVNTKQWTVSTGSESGPGFSYRFLSYRRKPSDSFRIYTVESSRLEEIAKYIWYRGQAQHRPETGTPIDIRLLGAGEQHTSGELYAQGNVWMVAGPAIQQSALLFGKGARPDVLELDRITRLTDVL